MATTPYEAITIDEAIRKLRLAKDQIGGDKCLILSLSGSGIEEANVNELYIIKEGESTYVQVRVNHPSLKDYDEMPSP